MREVFEPGASICGREVPVHRAVPAASALVVTALGASAPLGGALLLHAAHTCGVFGCDRPGTPIPTQAASNAPDELTLAFQPTASEVVCYEFQGTEDGSSVDLTSHEVQSTVPGVASPVFP